MVSSEKLHPGKFAGGRSSFSQTCTLLSQYLKEKGSFVDLTLNLTPKGTANLLPKIEQQDQNPGEPRPEKKIGQMTIFYGGQVIVLDEIPAEKAKEIMTLATNYSAAVSPIQKPAEPTAVGTTCGPHALQPPLLSSDLPITRKKSLARFLEKRKDRTAGTAPYQASNAAVKAEPWLELGSQLPLQIQRYYCFRSIMFLNLLLGIFAFVVLYYSGSNRSYWDFFHFSPPSFNLLVKSFLSF